MRAVGQEPGILRPAEAARHFDYRRHVPGASLAELVENFWTITWQLPPGRSYTAGVLPYPSVNLSVTNTEADVTGLVRRRYDRLLRGRGYAVGARFRAGCFRPFIAEPVSVLTDRHRPIVAVLGRSTAALEREVARTEDQSHRVRLLEAFLCEDLPAADLTCGQVADLVDQVARRVDLTRVSQVAALAGLSVRSLQRLFAEYVGASPKWVIQRCRLQDVAARAAVEEHLDWAALALELGFADQAHLTRAFAATIGTPPGTYVRQLR